MILGVIPARGGSKAVPRKNVREVAGRPLLAWTVDVAQAAESVDRVVVSTDDEAIAQVARDEGAAVPFLRPAKLARDDTPMVPTIEHAWQRYREETGFDPEYVACLQPTSPLRSPDDVDEAVGIARENDADAVVSVSPADPHPYWAKELDDEGHLRDFLDLDREYTRRQELPEAYALNGSIYLAKPSILQEGSWYAGETYGQVIPPERALDVDSEWELHVADLVVSEREGVDRD